MYSSVRIAFIFSSLSETFYKHKSSINSLLSLLDSKQLFVSSITINEAGAHSYDKVLPFLNKLRHGSYEESKISNSIPIINSFNIFIYFCHVLNTCIKYLCH